MSSFFKPQIFQSKRRGVFSPRGLSWFSILLLGGAIVASPGQQGGMGQQNVPSQLSQHGDGSFGSLFEEQNPSLPAKQMKALNEQRQKILVSDTDKLLKLAQDLNSEIASSSPSSLTPEEIHKISAIEKLAHSVKQKMSESFISSPALHDPIQPMR